MSSVLICPYSGLNTAVKRHRPSHLLSLLVEPFVPTPDAIRPDRHLRISVHDISEAIDGLVCPEHSHISEVVDFARGWDRKEPFLVHCWAGISRSTAAAFIVLCDIHGSGHERRIAQALRYYAPHAQPNRLMVQHADHLLQRKGEMIAAVAAMPPAVPAIEGELVRLPLDLEGL